MTLTGRIKKEYPFGSNFLTLTNGNKIHYIDEGIKSNFPTLFLHGNPTWSFFYRNLIQSLSGNYRCIAPDHLGCGLSDKPDILDFNYDLQGHADNFQELICHLNLEKFNLVVHDWGGAIGLTALRENFQRINKLVLLNTASFTSNDVPKRIKFCRIPVIGEFFVRQLNGFAGPATWMATNKKLPSDIKSGFLLPYNDWPSRIAIWHFVRDIPLGKNHPSFSNLLKTEEALHKLKEIPKIACWGMKDFCFHEGFLKKWKKILPNLTIHKIASAGHYLLEDEFEKCEVIIKNFFEIEYEE
tara:strand:+ start:967 stop:1860 length:894 start_codon:yes stop_codon:yes gene_type:complete